MLTNENLVLERIQDIGGLQRIYKFGNRFGLSFVNSKLIHSYKFAWEVAVLVDNKMCYDTPLAPGGIVVFSNDDEANAFIFNAKAYFESKEAQLLPEDKHE